MISYITHLLTNIYSAYIFIFSIIYIHLLSNMISYEEEIHDFAQGTTNFPTHESIGVHYVQSKVGNY